MFSKYISYLGNIDLSFLFLLFFIFSLVFQKRLSFIGGYSFLEGRYIEYLTYSLYGFEVLIALALAFWFLENLLFKKKIILGNKNILFSILALILFSIPSLFFSFDISISTYYLLILVELLAFYVFIINQLQRKEKIHIFMNVFLFTMFLQSIIAITQFILNHSIGLNLLGESPLAANLDGVAKTIIGGIKHIRAYGTFPHPNILALFLLVAGIINVYLFKVSNSKKYRIYLISLFIFLGVALFLTFSRVAWLLALIFWGYYIYKSKILNFNFLFFRKYKNKRSFLFPLMIILILITGLIYFAPDIWWRINPFLPSTWDSLNIRMVVFEKSWVLIKSHFWGVGIGNFVIAIAYQLVGYPVWMAEPVHNTFILILAEIGLLGLLSFMSILIFIFRSFAKIPDFVKSIFGILFVYMFFDHCFWDIRQTQFLLFLLIALSSLFIYQNKSSSSLD